MALQLCLEVGERLAAVDVPEVLDVLEHERLGPVDTKPRWSIMPKRYESWRPAPTGRNPLAIGSLRRYSVGVLSRSKAENRVDLETV